MDLYAELPTSSLHLDQSFEKLHQALSKSCITTFELLTLAPIVISKKCGRSINEINKFISVLRSELEEDLCIQKADHSESKPFRKFTVGDDAIDELLGGGISLGRITEVVGASSTGKSHLLMQITSTVQLPVELKGLSEFCSESGAWTAAKAVYISTEGNLETRRLQAISEYYSQNYTKKYVEHISGSLPSIDNVFQIQTNDLEAQDHIIFVQLPILLSTSKDIRLVIIDSIAHHIRVENVGTAESASAIKKESHWIEAKRKNDYVTKLGSFLNELAVNRDVAIVVSNQVSDMPLPEEPLNLQRHPEYKLSMDYQVGWMAGWNKQTILHAQGRPGSHADSFHVHNTQVPALGSRWSTHLSSRVLLKKTYKPVIFHSSDGEVYEDVSLDSINPNPYEKPKWNNQASTQGQPNGSGTPKPAPVAQPPMIDLHELDWKVKRVIGCVFNDDHEHGGGNASNGQVQEFVIGQGGIRSV